jgi:hypothetical protein
MYVNAKMISHESVPGIRRGRRKESSWKAEFKYNIFDILKEPCKCYKVLPLSTTIIKKRNKKESLFHNFFL